MPDAVAGPRVGLVHGLGETPAVWTALAPRLEALLPGVELVAPALPWGAAGPSGWAVRRDVAAWIDLAFPRPLDVLVAHSLGANVVLEWLVAGRGAAPGAVVLLAPFHRGGETEVAWADLDGFRADFRALLVEGLALRAPGADAELVGLMATRVADRIGPHGWLRFLDSFLATPWLDLTAARLPCLVVAGERDRAAHPGHAARLGDVLPDAEVAVLPGSGHFPMLDRPDDLAGVVGDFLLRRGPVGGAVSGAVGGAVAGPARAGEARR